VDFQATFAMNKIPKAMATIPVGREVRTLLPSTAHILAGETQIQVPTNVYIKVTYGAGATNTVLPLGTYLIFAGWLTGVGYRHTYNGMSMALEITHWLSALTFSSVLCEGSHPSNPSKFTFNQRVQLQPGAQGHLNPETMGAEFFSPADITDDMWGKCIVPWFGRLIGSKRLDQDAVGGQNNDSINGDAATALASFQGDKLPLDIGNVPADLVANAVGRHVTWRTLQAQTEVGALASLAKTTIWSKLIGELAPSLGFAVIPFPHKAMVVPFTAGLRNFWDPSSVDYTIFARDLDSYDVNANLIRPLRAWGFSVGHGGQWGDVTQKNEWPAATIGGWYTARDDGLVIIKQALPWLAEFADLSAYTKQTAGISNTTRSDAFNFPKEGVPPTVLSTKKVREGQLAMLDKLAHAAFVTEMLRNRTGRISGPMRFDICPGSTIRIEGTSGDFLAGIDPHGEPRYATVSQVSYGISAQSAQAATIYDLAHVRTQTENENDDTSVEQHPLYDRKWVGDYMLKAV